MILLRDPSTKQYLSRLSTAPTPVWTESGLDAMQAYPSDVERIGRLYGVGFEAEVITSNPGETNRA